MLTITNDLNRISNELYRITNRMVELDYLKSSAIEGLDQMFTDKAFIWRRIKLFYQIKQLPFLKDIFKVLGDLEQYVSNFEKISASVKQANNPHIESQLFNINEAIIKLLPFFLKYIEVNQNQSQATTLSEFSKYYNQEILLFDAIESPMNNILDYSLKAVEENDLIMFNHTFDVKPQKSKLSNAFFAIAVGVSVSCALIITAYAIAKMISPDKISEERIAVPSISSTNNISLEQKSIFLRQSGYNLFRNNSTSTNISSNNSNYRLTIPANTNSPSIQKENLSPPNSAPSIPSPRFETTPSVPTINTSYLASNSPKDIISPRGYSFHGKVNSLITAYNPTGKGLMRGNDKTAGRGITSVGKNAFIYDGIAVDPKLIPYGAIVYIPGVGYKIADDTGGRLRENGENGVYHVDIRMANYSSAIQFGQKQKQILVFLPKEEIAKSDLAKIRLSQFIA